MATSGDLLLATPGDFLMATGQTEAKTANSPPPREQPSGRTLLVVSGW
jgi:hypothetical protein